MELAARLLGLKKISSEAWLQMEADRDLIVSLMTLQQHFCIAECSISNPGRKSRIEGFIQHIQAMPFGVICFNEAGVRLYHDLAKQKPVF